MRTVDASLQEYRWLNVPKPHEIIGITGFESKSGAVHDLALVTWVLPVEAMDDEGQRSFHESEARIAARNKYLVY